MLCPKCGMDVPEGSKFCDSCGSNLQGVQAQSQENYEDEQEEQEEQEVIQQPSSAQYAYQPQPATYATYHTYQPQPQPDALVDPRDKPYGIGGWLGTLLLATIPIVGQILILVWAISNKTNKSKRNYCIAFIIYSIILIILGVVLSATFITMFGALLEEAAGYMY